MHCQVNIHCIILEVLTVFFYTVRIVLLTHEYLEWNNQPFESVEFIVVLRVNGLFSKHG